MCHNIIGRSIYVSLSFVTHLKSDFLFFLQTQSLHFLCQFWFRSLSWLGKSSSKSNFSGRQLTGFGFGRPKTTTSSSCHSSAAEEALQSLDFELRSQALRLQLNQSSCWRGYWTIGLEHWCKAYFISFYSRFIILAWVFVCQCHCRCFRSRGIQWIGFKGPELTSLWFAWSSLCCFWETRGCPCCWKVF